MTLFTLHFSFARTCFVIKDIKFSLKTKGFYIVMEEVLLVENCVTLKCRHSTRMNKLFSRAQDSLNIWWNMGFQSDFVSNSLSKLRSDCFHVGVVPICAPKIAKWTWRD